jgi:hypothetical protein
LGLSFTVFQKANAALACCAGFDSRHSAQQRLLAEFWLNLQTLYDLRIAEQKAGKAIKSLPKLQGTGRQLRELR